MDWIREFFISLFGGRHRHHPLYKWFVPIMLGQVRWLRRLEQLWLCLSSNRRYQDWIRHFEPDQASLNQEIQRSDEVPFCPNFLVIKVIRNFDLDQVSLTIDSIQGQLYRNWELYILFSDQVDHKQKETINILTKGDARVHCEFTNKGRSLDEWILREMEMTKYDFVIFIDENGILAPRAIWEFARIINDDPDIDWIYSDEDFLDEKSKRHSPWFKPDWSPELLLSINYLKPAVIRRELIERYFKDGKDQLANAWLETPIYFLNPELDKVYHSPNVLYHRLKHQKWMKTDRTMEPHHSTWVAHYLASCGMGNAQVPIARDKTIQLSCPPSDKTVSIIIPNRDNIQLLRRCVESILEHTHHACFHIILLNTGSELEETHLFYKKVSNHPKVQVVEYSEPFNYSRLNNYGAQVSSGDYLLFLNDDIEVEGPDWLDELMVIAQFPKIGIVGAKMSFPDRTIQHIGIILGLGGHAGHVFRGVTKGHANPYGSIDWYRNVLAVTGACMIVRREVFEELGGFDEEYEMVFSDVEFCLRAVEHGYRVAISPFTKVIHHEGATRGRYMPLSDLTLAFERFTPYLRTGDPYYNPNLSYSKTLPRIRRLKEIDRRDRVVRIIERYSDPFR